MHSFDVCRPKSIVEAVAYLAANPDAKCLAGGHSLVPVMKQGLASPSGLVDLNQLAELSGVSEDAGILRIGAMTRHEDVHQSSAVRAAIPALSYLAGCIGDPHVRHRGTIGGSLATNDPAGDFPAAALALNAVVATTKRRIPAEEFFQGLYSTSLGHDEIVLAVELKKPLWADYSGLRQAASGLALAGVFVAKFDSGVRIAATGAGVNGVFRATAFEQALNAKFLPASIEQVEVDESEMASDIHAGPAYRASLVKTFIRRAVEKYVADSA